MTEDRIRELLREMADEPVPPDSIARVRCAVEERVRSRGTWLSKRWIIASGILVSAAIVLIAVAMRAPVRVVLPALATTRTGEPAEIPPPVFPRPPVARPVVHRVPRAVHSENTAAVIRIETDDPDVVIVLVGG